MNICSLLTYSVIFLITFVNYKTHTWICRLAVTLLHNVNTVCIQTSMEIFFCTDHVLSHGYPVSGQFIFLQILDWVLRGAAQVMFVNNPLSGLIIFAGLILQNRWWALNGFVGTLFATISALILGQNRYLAVVHLHFAALNVWARFQYYTVFPSEVQSRTACMDITASWLVSWWRFSRMQEIGIGGCFFPTFHVNGMVSLPLGSSVHSLLIWICIKKREYLNVEIPRFSIRSQCGLKLQKI